MPRRERDARKDLERLDAEHRERDAGDHRDVSHELALDRRVVLHDERLRAADLPVHAVDDEADVAAALARVKEATSLPVAVGFGIKTPEQAAAIARLADGVVVGSALVNRIAESPENAVKAVTELATALAQATHKSVKVSA